MLDPNLNDNKFFQLNKSLFNTLLLIELFSTEEIFKFDSEFCSTFIKIRANELFISKSTTALVEPLSSGVREDLSSSKNDASVLQIRW